MKIELNSVYKTNSRLSGFLVTEIRTRTGAIKENEFYITRIKNFKFGINPYELFFDLEGEAAPTGLSYIIVGEPEISSFIKDLLGLASEDICSPPCETTLKKILNKKVDVFIKDKNVLGVSPICEHNKNKNDFLDYGNRPEDWTLE
ncbi:MAG TPA: hypothetical protein VJ438_05055 [Candidatus Nanoarchaeia archaeon]|nr:hypothetical protein [Candidatus Nanoarchaeia archaeon]